MHFLTGFLSLSPVRGVEDVAAIVSSFAEHVSVAAGYRSDFVDSLFIINECFAHRTVEDIIAALERHTSPFARATATRLRSLSPTGVKVTRELLHCSVTKHLSFEQCLEMELYSGLKFMTRPDFFEGVRSVLVDKGKGPPPRWQPACLEEVTDALVSQYLPDGRAKL